MTLLAIKVCLVNALCISMTVLLEYLHCSFSISTFSWVFFPFVKLYTITNPPSQHFLTHFFYGSDSNGNSLHVCCFFVILFYHQNAPPHYNVTTVQINFQVVQAGGSNVEIWKSIVTQFFSILLLQKLSH